jgi:hypothetical protein
MAKNLNLETVKQALRHPYKSYSGRPLGFKAHDGFLCHACVKENFRGIVNDIKSRAGCWNVYPKELWYDWRCVVCDKSVIPDKPDRIADVLEKLQTYWRKYPDLRLSQIVSNAWRVHPDYKNSPSPDIIQDIYYLADSKFLEGLEILSKDESKDQRSSEA